MEKYKNQMILETFAVYFTFTMPTNPLPDADIGHPQGALTLAMAVASNTLLLNYCILIPSTGRMFSLFIL